MGLIDRLFGQRLFCDESSCGRNITDSELTYLGNPEQGGVRVYHLGSCIESVGIRIVLESRKPIYARYAVISRGEAVRMLREGKLAQSPIEAVAEGK